MLNKNLQTHRFAVYAHVVAAIIVGAGALLVTSPVRGQTASQRLLAKMLQRFSANDSVRQTRTFSYELHLAATFYVKSDSAQLIEVWRISQDQDSTRAQLQSRDVRGKAEITKPAELPVLIQSVKRAPNQPAPDPVMQVVWDLLNRLKQEKKTQVMFDGETAGSNGVKSFILRFVADDRAGGLWMNAKTADLERIEWTYGKSLGFASSRENSLIEFTSVKGAFVFPSKFVINERSRALLRRTRSYVEIAMRNFQ